MEYEREKNNEGEPVTYDLAHNHERELEQSSKVHIFRDFNIRNLLCQTLPDLAAFAWSSADTFNGRFVTNDLNRLLENDVLEMGLCKNCEKKARKIIKQRKI